MGSVLARSVGGDKIRSVLLLASADEDRKLGRCTTLTLAAVGAKNHNEAPYGIRERLWLHIEH